MFKIKYNEVNLCNVKFIENDSFPKDLNSLKELKIFTGNNKEMYLDLNMNNQGSIYLGLNDLSNLDDLRMMGFNLGNILNSRNVSKASIDFSNLKDSNSLKSFIEGLMNSQYKFDYYKDIKNDFNLKEVSFNNLDNDKDVNEIY